MFGVTAVTQVFALRNGLGCGLTICVLFCRSYTSIKTFTLRRKMVMGGAVETESAAGLGGRALSQGQWLEPELSGAGTEYPPGRHTGSPGSLTTDSEASRQVSAAGPPLPTPWNILTPPLPHLLPDRRPGQGQAEWPAHGRHTDGRHRRSFIRKCIQPVGTEHLLRSRLHL